MFKCFLAAVAIAAAAANLILPREGLSPARWVIAGVAAGLLLAIWIAGAYRRSRR